MFWESRHSIYLNPFLRPEGDSVVPFLPGRRDVRRWIFFCCFFGGVLIDKYVCVFVCNITFHSWNEWKETDPPVCKGVRIV